LDIKELIRNDPVTCTCYYEHRMNSFRKLIQNTNLIFSQVKDYFFITKFQSRSSPPNHGFLWIKNDSRYGVFQNEKLNVLWINI
jgi:hypothetical protein